MRDARRQLEELTISDPAAVANMMRHLAAVSFVLTGRRVIETREDEPRLTAGFRLMGGAHHLCGAVTSRTGIDQVYVAFDVDDAVGPPIGLGLFRKEKHETLVYGDCRLWSPADGGRAILVPDPTGDHGHFAFQPGSRLKHLPGLPAGNLEPGLRRAAARRVRLLNSGELRNASEGCAVTRFSNVGRKIFVEVTPLSE
ncbi:hypothetical protein PQ455_13425 [Sphingomonas naphthae]|uniref:Uncharacterized protein n=1 Tax=Sphingomonas naphthae TaxID=1813468 RepID=A0ABY7THV1_9SPHN|nr:hypothetical protein [Sphingomonas naphthae]WCT72628.1 hypothetical protein PQ455_13425 [Sphingomonas naphthae]